MNRASIDISKTENKALKTASDDGGMYLEALGKTDLATMSVEEWNEFVKVLAFSYAEAMADVVEIEEGPPYD